MSPTPLQLALLLLGSTLLGVEIWRLRMAMKSRSWACTEGEVTAVRMEEGFPIHVNVGSTDPNDKDDDPVRPVVCYTYSVRGKTFNGSRLFFGPPDLIGYIAGSDAIEGLQRGMKVRVHYDPARPGRSVLRPGPRASSYTLAGTYLVLLAAVAYASFF